LALTLIGNLLAGWNEAAIALLMWVLLCRGIMARTIDSALDLPRSPLRLVPIRDMLSFAVFLASFFIRTVAWRGQRLRIGRGGELIQGRR
jgi:ceramide glucosyltransferase